MRFLAALGLAATALTAQILPTVPVLVRVPATANPYLAGMPDETGARLRDHAPQQSPVEVPLSLTSVAAVTFRVTGGMTFTKPSCPPRCATPDGVGMGSHVRGSEHGIADVRAPMNSLVGVFLGAQRPDRTRAPKGLDFRDNMEFTQLAPQLKQVFFIGAGANRAGVPRRYAIPAGATRLFLGTMGRDDWWNATGGFSVTVIIERKDISSQTSGAGWPCMPHRTNCMPAQPIVEERGSGQYHVVMPAPLAWGVSVPNPSGSPVTISGAMGTICLDIATNSFGQCYGLRGTGEPPSAGPGGSEFLVPDRPAGALVIKTEGGRTYFSVNGYSGPRLITQEGYFEFDVTIR